MRVPVAFTAVVVALAASCGSADDTTSPATTTSDAAATTAASTPTVTTDTPPTTATPESTDPTTTSSTNTNTTEPGTPTSLELPIPPGSFDVNASDVFVLNRNGDLELWSAALTSSSGPRTLVADYPDPFGVVTEGPGPNVIDQVAGVVDGAVLFGDCCEPISGNILAATSPAEVSVLAGGYSPTLSPDGGLLGAANDYVIAQTATDGDGSGILRGLNQDPTTSYLNVADLTWSSNATTTGDDDHLVLLGWTDEGWALHDVDRSTLEPTLAFELGIPAVAEAPDTDVRFAGHGPHGEIVVAERSPSGTRLRFFAASTLTELPLLERSLPASARSIRLADDGLGLLWVDETTLYHLRADELVPSALGEDVLAAWFAA